MDTVKRSLDRGRQMRLHIGDLGPLPGIQQFECTGSIDVERNGEYDSDEQIITLGLAQFSGNIEVLDNERDDLYRALTGKTASILADITIDNYGELPFMLNVWNRGKTRFTKSYLVVRPTITSDPYPTSLQGVTRMRFEYQAVRGVRFPKHACGFLSYAEIGVGPYSLGTAVSPIAAPVPKKLSRRFQGQYVACVLEKVPDSSSSGDFDYNYLCVQSSSATAFTLRDTPTAGGTVIAYFAYTSTAEAGGYICQTT